MSKRSHDGGAIHISSKRMCPGPTLKRSADFDCEVEHIHKRLKATTPTPEQAMAFLLPHLLAIRALYTDVVKRNETLTEHNTLLSSAYKKLALESVREKNQLERELAMSKYQLQLSMSTTR
jgi:hypothetical protein